MILKNGLKLLLLILSLSHACAETLWELGTGVGHLTANAYIGSSDTIVVTSPIPFIKIKTELFDLSEGDIQMNWFEQTPFRLSFNFDLGLPVKSEDVLLRDGMPDLDTVLQVGPMLKYQFESDTDVKWKLELPLVFALTLGDADQQSIGRSFTPRLVMNYQNSEKKSPLDLEISFGPVHGTSDYHQFYYSVDSAYATADREQYSAHGGFAGYRLSMSLSKRVEDIWFGVFLRYQDLSDATFADSPLVDQRDYWLVTFGVSWIFAGNM